MKIKKILIRFLIIFILFFSANICAPAQDFYSDPEPNEPGDPGGDPTTPIDGGLTVLLAAGVGYGVKKYRDTKKQKNFSES